MAGREDERKFRILVTNRREEFEAVGLRHPVVADDTVDRRPIEVLERRRGAGFGVNGEPVDVAEHRRGERDDRFVVVHEQHSDRFGLGARRSLHLHSIYIYIPTYKKYPIGIPYETHVVTSNRAPSSTSTARTSQPWASAMLRTIINPSPVPESVVE